MEHNDAKWHYPKLGEYPIKFGKYTQQNYPQIPCLVLYNGMYGVRFWNCTEECWDDEECDDFFCKKEAVEKWIYIDIDAPDSFQQKISEISLEEFIEKIEDWKARFSYPDSIPVKATIAFTARMFYMYPDVARQWYDSLPKATQD